MALLSESDDPDVIQSERNPPGIELLDGEIVGLAEAMVTETLETLVAVECTDVCRSR